MLGILFSRWQFALWIGTFVFAIYAWNNGNRRIGIALGFLFVATSIAAAIPGWKRAAPIAHRNSCAANLRQIRLAMETAADESNRDDQKLEVGSITPFLKGKQLPRCPDRGTYYLTADGKDAGCTFHARMPENNH